jgi:hypothetical protein
MVDALEVLADDHADAAEFIVLGESTMGRPIVGLRLGRSANPIRSMRVLGAHHGDETSSAEVAFQSAKDLLENPSWTSILDDHEVWVVPHVNPDGIESGRRYNSNEVDLNRNYGFEWSPTEFRSGDGPFSEPETKAMRTLGDHVAFGLGLSVHSGATNLGWVWNYTTDRTADETLLDHLAASYEEECTTPTFYTTNGADWYITRGDTTDWSYGLHGTLDFTLEVSADKHPSESAMAEVVEQHEEAIPTFLDWPWWVAGTVVDASSGQGLKARISIEDSERFVTSDYSGRFSRPVDSGEWTLVAVAPGFEPESVTMDANGGPVDIELSPIGFSGNGPEDRHLSMTGAFTLRRPAESVQLTRIGHTGLNASGAGTEWFADPSELAPGPWSLVIDGLVAPNALFAPESSGVELTEVTVLPETIELGIDGMASGVWAWGLWGDARNPVRLNAVQLTGDRLQIDRSELPDGGVQSDILVWTNGSQLAAVGLSPPPETPPADTGSIDTAEPDDTFGDAGEADTLSPPSGIVSGRGKLKASGCSSTPLYQGWMWLVSLVALMTCRRKPCEHLDG